VRRRRRGCRVFIAGKGPRKEEKRQAALSGIISHLMAKCGGNLHDRGAVKITASSNSDSARNATDLGNIGVVLQVGERTEAVDLP
jgi:hypothetical protein